MTHPTRRFHLSLFTLLAASAGCVEAIEAFPDRDQVDAETADAGALVDAAQLRDSQPQPDPQTEADGGAPFDGGTCTLTPGGRQVSTCRRAYQSCAIGGPAFAEATFIGCTDARGVGGNPLQTVTTCEQALWAQSGETCLADLKCTGPSEDTCCVRHAECTKDGSLKLAEICVPECERTPLLPGPTVHDCAELAAVDAEPEDRYGSGSKLPNLVGLPCDGEFECGPESSYGFSLFCGAGRMQLLPLGPSGFGTL